MGGKGSTKAKMPTPQELGPLLELQSKYNRVGVATPFGAQRYDRGPNGEYTMTTDIGDEGKALVSRAVGLGMTDSNRLQTPGQLGNITGALLSRVGQRVGSPMGSFATPVSQAPAQAQQKPQQQQMPPPNNLPGAQ